MDFFEKNKAVLLNKYPGFYEELISENDDGLLSEDIKIEITPAGDPTLNIKGIYIHSPRDPVRESARLAETFRAPKNPSFMVILGFGLGYAAQAAAEPEMPVIIVEKYNCIFLKALENRDLSGILSDSRLIFVVGGNGEGITSALSIANNIALKDRRMPEDDKKLSPLIIRNKALISLDEQWYKQAEERINTWSVKDDVNIATHKRFGKRWVRNLSRNMSVIRDLPGVARLAGIASGEEIFFPADKTKKNEHEEGKDFPIPVFLAAAGPSLDKIKSVLRDIYERCFIVAVDTSLRFFVNNGIHPDFVLVVDPQFWNSRHLDRCADEQTRSRTALIAESAVYPPVLSLPFKNKFLCGSLFPLGTFIEKQVDQKGRLAAGGSVATTAWDFARLLGETAGDVSLEKTYGQEIWIAGLDLAFPGFKTHFHGARFEESSNSQSSRFNPVEKWIVRALRDGIPFKALSGNGGQVLTDKRLSLYKAWFENQFRLNPNVKNYQLSRDGIDIAGFFQADIEKLLSLPRRREEINRRINNIFYKVECEFNEPEEKQKRHERYEKAVNALNTGLGNIGAAAEEGKETARRALRYPLNPSQQEKVLNELDRITRRLSESEVKEVAGFLFPAVEEEKDDNDPFRAYLKTSLELFSGITEAADFIRGVCGRA